MDKLKHFTAPSHWSYWGLVFSHNDSQFPFPVVCLKSQCNDTESFRRQKSFSPQKLKLLICPWKVTLFSEESSCKYKWIIRSLSVEIGTHCGYKDTAVWQRELFPAHDARRWEVWVPWWVFRMPRSPGNPQFDPLCSSSAGGLAGPSGARGTLPSSRQQTPALPFRLLPWKPQEEAGCWVVGAFILILHFAWPPLPQLTFINFSTLFARQVRSTAENLTPEGALCPVCLFLIPFLCAQGRLSAARHQPWWEQRDGQRADRGGGEVRFNQLQSQSRFFMANLRVLHVQRKPDGLRIIWKRPIDTEARLINLALLKLPVCVEYRITRVCSSRRQSSFLTFDLIMRLILDVTADWQAERVGCVWDVQVMTFVYVLS